MTVYLPWGLIAIFIAFYIFYDHNHRSRLKREERRDELKVRRQELVNQLIKSKSKPNDGSEVIDEKTGDT
jgi:hypothetical protein